MAQRAEVEADEEPTRSWMGWLGGIAAVAALVGFLAWRRSGPVETADPTPAAEPAIASESTPEPAPMGGVTLAPPVANARMEGEKTVAPIVAIPEAAPVAPQSTAVPTEEARDPASVLQEECDSGSGEGCANLAELYRQGRGVPQDASRAADLLERACDRGTLKGCEALGLLYLRGQGVTQDPERAASFLKTACEGGSETACRALEDLKAREGGADGDGRRPPPPPPPGGGRR